MIKERIQKIIMNKRLSYPYKDSTIVYYYNIDEVQAKEITEEIMKEINPKLYCRNCDKKIENCGEYTLENNYGSFWDTERWDFCSLTCLKEYIKNLKY